MPQYAGFWRRIIALLVDVIFFAPLIYVMTVHPTFEMALLYQAVVFLFYVGFISSVWQASPAQKLLKIKVGDCAGNRISKARTSVLYLTWSVPALPSILYDLWINFIHEPSAVEAFNTQASLAETPEELQALMAHPLYHDLHIVLGYVLCVTFVVGLIWTLSIVFSKEKAGIHNKLTDTRVFLNT